MHSHIHFQPNMGQKVSTSGTVYSFQPGKIKGKKWSTKSLVLVVKYSF